jgi:exosortase/archaeosortase family protein
MSITRRIVLFSALALFGVWMSTHWGRLTGDPDSLIRFTLGALFAIAIIARRKDPDNIPFVLPRWIVPILLFCGTLAALGGIIFKVHIVEWIGVLLLLFACSVWITPAKFGPDLILAFVVLFWMHPLPGQVFGWLQAGMQRLSVIGSEFILHAANIRVWGDATVLHTGYQDFMVPEACSGMRTAVTVFLCTLGVGILLRLKWFETLTFVFLGLLQVLVLNIVRISFMVMWAPRMPPEWASTFLHDSLAIFLMGAILLVQLEASWWCWWSRRRQRIKAGIRDRSLEAPDKASVVPHSLRRLGFVLVIVSALGLMGLGVAGLIYKGRAHHRKEMIREVARGLMESAPDAADRAIKAALRLAPGDSELLSMQARTALVRGRFEEGLAIFDAKRASGESLALEDQVLQSWALMRMDRIVDAKVIVDALPPGADRLPGVAMLKAEFAAMEDQSEDAARYVVLASRSPRMLRRIRALFRYLAMHEQWAAIAESDGDQPYDEITHALVAVHANHRVADLAGVGRVMAQAVEVWPDDPRFLTDLYRLAQQRQGGDWEARFERNLRANFDRLSADMLVMVQDYCWRIARPDLAWIAFSHLQRHDPADPALLVAPAQYGRNWSRFRRHQLGVEAENVAVTLDLRPVVDAFSACAPFDGFTERIPLLSDVSSAAAPKFRKRCLERCLKELALRESEGPLGNRLMRLYPMVLAMSDRYDEAHARLDRIAEAFPDQKAAVVFQHGAFYDQQGMWQKSYEALREHAELVDSLNLTRSLLTIKAMMNMNLGVCAMDVLRDSRDAFPGAQRLSLAEAAIWDVFGYKEQALALMSRVDRGENSPTAVGLLHDTGRINAARTLSEALGIPMPARVSPQVLRLPSATESMARRWPAPSDSAERAKRIAELESRIAEASSPYTERLLKLELAWQEAAGALSAEGEARRGDTDGGTAGRRTWDEECEKWAAAGRDGREQVGALYQLAMLAARDEDYGLADAALTRGLELMPDSPVLWRAHVAVTEGASNIVAEAYKHCPNDPEIWLANLVVTTKALPKPTPPNAEPGTRNAELGTPNAQPGTPNAQPGTPNPQPGTPNPSTLLVSEAIASGMFAPGTLVRAGDYLLSERHVELAAQLARAAIPKARGLLAAYVLGLRTALLQGDAIWAQACAISGVENARNPTPFYKTLVDIKAARRQVDSDLLSALEYLQDRETAEPRWAETLGRVYFQKGDMRRALSIFSSVIDGDTKGVNIRSMILAAEAARRNSKDNKAISILEAAYEMQPERLSVLNNLVYLLAQDPQTISRARALMPKLLKIGSDSFAVMDTAAVVYLRSGDLVNAKIWMDRAMASLDDDSYSAQEIRLNSAELLARRGDFDEARKGVAEVRQNAERTDYVDQKARGLLRDIETLDRR